MSTLSLLDPKGLLLLGLLAPLVVLYILKVRRTRAVVASTWLWEAAARDLLAQSPFRRLRPHLSLLLQALALGLLALALARPSTLGEGAAGVRIALVVDVSASMGATTEEATTGVDPAARPTSLTRAQELGKELLRSLPPGSEAMLVEASRSAAVASPLDRDVRRVESAVDALSIHEVEGDLQAAVALAIDRLDGLEGARVVVLTDAHLARPLEVAGSAVPVEIVQVGREPDNAAIVRADVRLGIDRATSAEEVQAFALVANLGASPRELFVTVRYEGTSEPLDSRRVLLAPGEKSPVSLGFRPTSSDAGRGLVFELSPHDALEVDDRAFGRVPEGGRLPVVLARAAGRASSPWLERALEADAGIALDRVEPDALGEAGRVPAGALVVVEGACPAANVGGSWLVVDPPEGECQGVRVGARIEAPAITSWATSDARLRFLSLDGVSIAQARDLEPASPSGSLVRTSSATIVADASNDARSVTIVGFDVGDSDWPLKASFVLFVRNVVESARLARQSTTAGHQTPGEPLRVRVPLLTERAQLVRPDGRKEELSARGGWVVVPATNQVGHYAVEPLDRETSTPLPGARVVVPVSLASEAESELRGRSPMTQAGAAAPRSADELPPARREWAWLAALVALLLVVAEVFVATREVRRRGVVVAKAPERRRA